MIDYYSKRANEYERIYQKPERQADLGWLKEILRRELTGHRVLELACGTGSWTEAIAGTAAWVHATDASNEVLEIARSKQLDPAKVTFAHGDAYHPLPATHPFTAGFAGFWWSHVPKLQLPGFLESFHAALSPGSRVVFADNIFVTGSSTPLSRHDDEGNTYQLRLLSDGSRHEVLKNFPSVEELREVIAPFSGDIEVLTSDYFWCASYRTALG
jgi:demethylmenaquinone methyltransferase/2-methoxy-6-polyprenyl-1,4-benzoquinol methylase